MSLRTRIAGLSLLLASAGADTTLSAATPDSVQAHLDRMVQRGEVPGIQYLVVTRDGLLFEAAAGVRDVATGLPMERATLQMAYSTTKAITAVAAMQLVEAGKLELDRPLDAYYPSHPYGSGVTIRSLLAQTSGVPNPMPTDWLSLEGEPLDRDEKLRAVLAESPELDHPAGSEYGYSNLSYWLLEKAIEAASGEDYARYVGEHVFSPLSVGPRDAGFELGTRDEMATGHSPRWGLTTFALAWMAPSSYWAEPHGGFRRAARLSHHGRGYGGLFCNASALAAVLQDLLRDEPLLMSRRTRDAMFTPQRTSGGEVLSMTLGWVTGETAGARYFGKQGGGLGFHGNVRIYPDKGVATVFLANRTEITAGPIDERSDELDAFFVRSARISEE